MVLTWSYYDARVVGWLFICQSKENRLIIGRKFIIICISYNFVFHFGNVFSAGHQFETLGCQYEVEVPGEYNAKQLTEFLKFFDIRNGRL